MSYYPSQPMIPQPKKSKMKYFIIAGLVGLILLIIAGVVAYVMLSKKDSGNDSGVTYADTVAFPTDKYIFFVESAQPASAPACMAGALKSVDPIDAGKVAGSIRPINCANGGQSCLLATQNSVMGYIGGQCALQSNPDSELSAMGLFELKDDGTIYNSLYDVYLAPDGKNYDFGFKASGQEQSGFTVTTPDQPRYKWTF